MAQSSYHAPRTATRSRRVLGLLLILLCVAMVSGFQSAFPRHREAGAAARRSPASAPARTTFPDALFLRRRPARPGRRPPVPPLRSSEEMTPIENMKAQEIKAELDMREISYVGCYDKTDLIDLLKEARATGKCDPSVLTEFNRQMAERMTGSSEQVDVQDVDLNTMKAGDGSLPGGLSPEMMSKLTSNPEVMAMLANPKLQEVMKKVMEGGPDAAIELMKDPDTKELMGKLTSIMSK